jgi:hypothetical protein
VQNITKGYKLINNILYWDYQYKSEDGSILSKDIKVYNDNGTYNEEIDRYTIIYPVANDIKDENGNIVEEGYETKLKKKNDELIEKYEEFIVSVKSALDAKGAVLSQ